MTDVGYRYSYVKVHNGTSHFIRLHAPHKFTTNNMNIETQSQ